MGSGGLDSGHRQAHDEEDTDAAARPHHAQLGSLVPQVAVLRRHPSRRLLRLRRLSAHAPPQHLRRSRRGVLGARERRDPVGRERGAHRRDHRARRERVHEPAHLPRPHEVRREAGQVHAGHRRGRRHRERPGAAARRGEPLVARARRLRRRPVRDGRRGQLGARRARRPPRRLPGAGAGPEGQGHDARPVRRLDPGHEVLLVRRGRPGRHPGRDQPHRLDRGGRLRDLPARPEPRRRPVGAHPGRRQAVQHPRHALVGHPAHRGRHLRLGLRHRPRRQPLRGHRAGAAGRGAGGRLHRQGGARADPARGRRAQAGRDRARGRPGRAAHAALAGRAGPRDGRPRHRRVLVAAPQEEHRLRLGADRARRARHPSRRPDRRRERQGTTATLPFIDPNKKVPAA